MSSSYTAVGPPGAPAIVLVHGTRLSRGMWHPQLAALSGGFRVIALDLPGHGALRHRPFDWDEAVDEIAWRSGFGTAASLRDHFRRATETTPMAYRRSFRPLVSSSAL